MSETRIDLFFSCSFVSENDVLKSSERKKLSIVFCFVDVRERKISKISNLTNRESIQSLDVQLTIERNTKRTCECVVLNSYLAVINQYRCLTSDNFFFE